jgi:hypothetical protein
MRRLIINDVVYGSINEACKKLEITRYALFKSKLINKKEEKNDRS